MLRQFLYLDQDLVRDFLAQAEGGLYDETRELSSSQGQHGLEGRVAAGPLAAGGQRSKSAHAETESVVRQTAPSEFDRLYSYLDASGVQVYDAVDEPLESLPIGRKDIIEVDARLRVSGLHQLMDVMGKVGRLAPILQQYGEPGQVDPEMLAAAQAISGLMTDMTSIALIGNVPGAAGVRLALELRTIAARVDDWDTEATVLLKVQRLLRRGQSEMVGDPFGGLLRVVPEEQRKKLLLGLEIDEMARFGVGESEISYPAIVGTPIAIYR